MSWLYSLALVVEYSVDTCSDGVLSAPSSASPTPQAYLSPDKMTAYSRLSRFGMTCEPLMESLGAELSAWCRAAFPVRTYLAPERAQELTGNDQDSGEKWPGSLARYDRNSRSWKTAQYSLLGGSAEFSETWPRWGTMRSGVCWERQTLVPLTAETESGYWPTPIASMAIQGQNQPDGRRGQTLVGFVRGQFWPTPRANDAEERGSIDATNPRNGLPGAVQMWPTPNARDWKDTPGMALTGTNPDGSTRTRTDQLARAVYATPQSRDFRTGQQERYENPNRTKNLNDQIGGQLNPTWVEWLMGWPLGWTDSKPLETDKFLSAQPALGAFCFEDWLAVNREMLENI